MALFGNWSWAALRKAVFSPAANGLDAKIGELKPNLPIPVFWLLGKTQAGKTSVIRALTGSSRAEIGNHFQPCTRRSSFYDFPSEQHPIMRFLDTRGLGEAAYDSEPELAWCADQAHLLMVVTRAADMNLAELLKTVRHIHGKRPDWPIIVVQTALHDAYAGAFDHVEPYPYARNPWPAAVPPALAQALTHQRGYFQGLPAQFVAVDLTLPEDGFGTVDYGLDALWDAIETAYPAGVIGLLRDSEHHRSFLDFHARQAHPHIIGYSVVNMALGAIPVAGLPLVIAAQAKLFHSIAALYNLKLTPRLYAEFTGLIGMGMGFGLLGRELIKLIPVYGSAAAGLYAGAMTYALGRAFCRYLHGVKRGALPDAGAVREAYADAFQLARQYLQTRGGR